MRECEEGAPCEWVHYFDVIAFIEKAIGVMRLGRCDVRHVRKRSARTDLQQPGHFQRVDFGVEKRFLNGNFAHQDSTFSN